MGVEQHAELFIFFNHIVKLFKGILCISNRLILQTSRAMCLFASVLNIGDEGKTESVACLILYLI